MAEIEIGKVKLDLEDIWEAIPDKAFVEELNERAGHTDIVDWVAVAVDEASDNYEEPEVDDIFKPLSDWDRDCVLAAIKADDGRRVIDLLKRAAA